MRSRLAAMVAAASAACSVPGVSLDGKQCPCTDGYVCDTVTNRCLTTNDGGVIIDSPAATQCIASAGNETEIYRYTGTFDWQHGDNSWTGSATEIQQTSSNAQNSYTYKTAAPLTSSPDVHVIASMREIEGGVGSPTLGIVLRAQLDPQNENRYTCAWSRKDRELRIELQNGGTSSVVGAAAINPASTLPTSFTMEAFVDANVLGCCIRELPDAKLTVTDATNAVMMGYPGLGTHRMKAAFGSFVVFKRP